MKKWLLLHQIPAEYAVATKKPKKFLDPVTTKQEKKELTTWMARDLQEHHIYFHRGDTSHIPVKLSEPLEDMVASENVLASLFETEIVVVRPKNAFLDNKSWQIEVKDRFASNAEIHVLQWWDAKLSCPLQKDWWNNIADQIVLAPESLYSKFFYFRPKWLLLWWKHVGDRIFNETARLYYEFDIYVEGWRPLLSFLNWLILMAPQRIEQGEMILYRGEKVTLEYGNVGDLVPVSNIWAVTPNIRSALDFTGAFCCLFELNVPGGFPLLCIDKLLNKKENPYPGEDEVLLPYTLDANGEHLTYAWKIVYKTVKTIYFYEKHTRKSKFVTIYSLQLVPASELKEKQPKQYHKHSAATGVCRPFQWKYPTAEEKVSQAYNPAFWFRPRPGTTVWPPVVQLPEALKDLTDKQWTSVSKLKGQDWEVVQPLYAEMWDEQDELFQAFHFEKAKEKEKKEKKGKRSVGELLNDKFKSLRTLNRSFPVVSTDIAPTQQIYVLTEVKRTLHRITESRVRLDTLWHEYKMFWNECQDGQLFSWVEITPKNVGTYQNDGVYKGFILHSPSRKSNLTVDEVMDRDEFEVKWQMKHVHIIVETKQLSEWVIFNGSIFGVEWKMIPEKMGPLLLERVSSARIDRNGLQHYLGVFTNLEKPCWFRPDHLYGIFEGDIARVRDALTLIRVHVWGTE